LGDCSLWAISFENCPSIFCLLSQSDIRYFTYILDLTKKLVGLHFGRFFTYNIRSHCTQLDYNRTVCRRK
jgi:hypothetical protein